MPSVTALRRIGLPALAGEVRRRIASTEVNVGLRCDLTHLPQPREARIPLRLERQLGTFLGFQAELDRTTGPDHGRIVRRKELYEQGVPDMYAAIGEDGDPTYVQWLITRDSQAMLGDSAEWPELELDEVLLEFAYTFTPSRGMGVMGDAMGRLLRVAKERGAHRALTYVRDDNIPSLRGCSNVGFDLDHVRDTTYALGTSRHRFRPPGPDDRRRWDEATAARPRS